MASAILTNYLSNYEGSAITVIGRKSILSPLITSSHVSLFDLPRPLGIISDIPAISIYLFALTLTRKAFLYINFSDIPTLCFDTQVFFFDWPYAVTASTSWGLSTKTETVLRTVKLFLYRAFTPFVSHYICQTNYIKSLLIKSGLNPNRISVNPLGITQVSTHSRNPRLSSDCNFCLELHSKYDNIMFCPNAYNAHKGFNQIVDLASSGFLEYSNILLVLLIDARTFANISRQLTYISMTHVALLGPLASEQMSEQYLRASIVLNPSQLETFGFAYYESASYGLRQVVPSLPHVPSFASTYNYSNNSLSSMIRSIQMALQDLDSTGPLDTSLFIRELTELASRSFRDFSQLLTTNT